MTLYWLRLSGPQDRLTSHRDSHSPYSRKKEAENQKAHRKAEKIVTVVPFSDTHFEDFRPVVKVTLETPELLAIRFPYQPSVVETCRAIGARARKENGLWRWVIPSDRISLVRRAFPDAWIDSSISAKTSGPADDGPQPDDIAVPLMPFQRWSALLFLNWITPAISSPRAQTTPFLSFLVSLGSFLTPLLVVSRNSPFDWYMRWERVSSTPSRRRRQVTGSYSFSYRRSQYLVIAAFGVVQDRRGVGQATPRRVVASVPRRTTETGNARKTPAPVNWLARLDATARELPQAKSWTYYPYFMFARYPRLIPEPTGGDIRRELHLESGAEAFEQSVAEWEGKISSPEATRRVVSDLCREQRWELAALVLDTVTAIADYRRSLPWHKRLRRLASEKPRRERMLKRKLGRLDSKIDETIERYRSGQPPRGAKGLVQEHEGFQEYVAGLDPMLRPGGLREGLPPVESVRFSDFAGLLRDPQHHPIPVDPVTLCMVQLYWFFRHGCDLTGNESEVRVALVRNILWTRYGVSEVPFLGAYDVEGTESAGCPAVAEAVRRYSRQVTRQ